ncbi:MAG: PadR family transcriptional regulator [Promethearchaeota archaeon]|jgi:DNA-binding PadR family transcriptional regulator
MFFGKRFRGYQTDTLSGLEILVLKIIKNNEGITGYDITQRINRRFRGLWRGSAGTIYPLLKSLTDNGVVEISEVIEGNRLKKKYSITEKGVAELRNVLDVNIQPSVNSLMDFISTMIDDIPRIRHNVETMFCSYPHHRSVMNVKIDESDFSLQNINRIKDHIETLEMTRNKLQKRVGLLNNQIEDSRSVLREIEEKRKDARIIDILDDDDYDKKMMNI